MLVQSGRIHAIDAGNLILEIQQNSDTTYRVYDWGRLGLDNKPRQLHVEESMQCVDFMDFEPIPLKSKDKMILANAKEFRIKKVNLLSDSNLLLRVKILSVQLLVLCKARWKSAIKIFLSENTP